MKRILIFITVPLLVFSMVSCATFSKTSSNDQGYDKVQIIDVSTNTYTNPNTNIPLSAVIEPENLVTSPIIDITTLKAQEIEEQGNIKSSTLEQQTRKEEIQENILNDPYANTELDDSTYGEGSSSGALANKATEDSFKYITSSSSFTGAIAVYDWIEGNIYEIITSPKAITDFRLKPGESVTGAPIVNDGGTSWQFTMGNSIEDGVTIQHLFIKPSVVGLDTSMIVLTNERTYYFRIASFENHYMTALRFNYPTDSGKGYYVSEDFEEYIADAAIASSAYSLDLTKANYNYKIKIAKGKPSWTPQAVFSDDKKTYIQLPVSIAVSDELPTVYVIRNKEEALVNFRYIGNIIQIDTVITSTETLLLKSSDKEQVKITRND